MVDPRAVVVAVRAAELALASGVDLPDDLALWRLAGGRPRPSPVPGRPEDLGLLLEATLDAHDRRTRGAHYTPQDLADGLVARALARHHEPAVCDPACGGGMLLLAAGRHQEAAGGDPRTIVERLWGIDIDPVAVATTEATLALWSRVSPPAGRLFVADALLDPPPMPLVDVVVGNPPFLSQLDAMTVRGAADAARLRERFGAAVRAYTDAAGLFLLAGCSLTRVGGTVAMVLPQSVMAARDASGVREALDACAHLCEVWVPPGRPFQAAVEVCVPVLEVGRRGPVPSAWSAHLARAHGVPAVDLRTGPTVGDEATTSAAFRAEYYGIAPHVYEADDLPAGRPLLTTGLVDLGEAAWGERLARVAGRRWKRPVVDVDALEGRAAAWARRTDAPKLIVATQTRVIEAVVDCDGRFLPGVPLVVALLAPERLGPIAAAVCSPPITAWAAQRAAGTALTPNSLKVTAAILREAPLPCDIEAWKVGIEAFEAHDAARFAEAMTAAYACDASVSRWWVERLGSAWSAGGSNR